MRRRFLLVPALFVLVSAAAVFSIVQSASAGQRALPSDVSRFIAVTTTEVDAQDAASVKADRVAICGLWTDSSAPHLNAAQRNLAGSVLANAEIVASAPPLLRWLTQLKTLHARDSALAAYVGYVEKERAPVAGLARLPRFNACRFLTDWQKAHYPTSQNAAAVLGPTRYGLLVSYAVYACTSAGVKTALIARLRSLGATRAQLGVVSGSCIGGATGGGGSSGSGTAKPPASKPKGPGNLPACNPTTHIYPSLSAGPANTQITLNFSSDPNPRFDGFELYGNGTGIEEGGGYPGPLKVLLHGAVGQKETFVLVRDYNNAGQETPTCVSARAVVKITSGAVKTNPPPPPATPSLPRCPVQVTATLTPTSGPSGTQVTLQFAQPADSWDGFQFEASLGRRRRRRRRFPGRAHATCRNGRARPEDRVHADPGLPERLDDRADLRRCAGHVHGLLIEANRSRTGAGGQTRPTPPDRHGRKLTWPRTTLLRPARIWIRLTRPWPRAARSAAASA